MMRRLFTFISLLVFLISAVPVAKADEPPSPLRPEANAPVISPRLRPPLIPGTLALVILAGGGLWYAGRQGPSAGEVSTDQYGDRIQTVPAGKLPVFAREAGPKVREAYRFASSEQGKVLEWIPCYCGCRNIGHRHNRDCYLKDSTPREVTFTSHGAT